MPRRARRAPPATRCSASAASNAVRASRPAALPPGRPTPPQRVARPAPGQYAPRDRAVDRCSATLRAAHAAGHERHHRHLPAGLPRDRRDVRGRLRAVPVRRAGTAPGRRRRGRPRPAACSTWPAGPASSPARPPSGSARPAESSGWTSTRRCSTSRAGSGPELEWRQGDAAACRSRMGRSTSSLCQSGLMFVPDDAAAVPRWPGWRTRRHGRGPGVERTGTAARIRPARRRRRPARRPGAVDLISTYFRLGDPDAFARSARRRASGHRGQRGCRSSCAPARSTST